MVEIKFVPVLHYYVHSLIVFHLLVGLITMMLTIPVAMLTFAFVEMPFLRLKRYLKYERGQCGDFWGPSDKTAEPIDIATRP